MKLPRKRRAAKTYLTHEQVAELAAASKHPTLVLFLAYTGLRWGEATGLRVKHVDALRRRVNVVENAVLLGGRVEVGTPKTHERRSVPYPAFLALPIAKLCEGKRREDLVFGDGLVHMRLPNSVNGWFAAAVKRAQADERERLGPLIAAAEAAGEQPPEPAFPRVTPHDLRHTAASLAISAGANVKAVQRMLGHASAAMTLDVYAELFGDDLDTVAEALDRAHSATTVSTVLSRGTERT